MRWPALFLTAGLGMAHYPMLFSGFRHLESDLLDGRFFNYVLEHTWRWLTGAPHHSSLWSPPFFFPAENAGAYSEILLGAAPPYFLARWIGLEMDSAYQFWLLALGLLNFGSMLAFARRALGASPLAAAVAGALFAFAGPRLAEATWGHYQVFPQFWTILALLAFAIASGRGTWRARRAAAFLVGPCLALQLWSGFYVGWFVVLVLPFVLLFAFALPDVRAAARRERRLLAPLLAGGVVAALLLAPLASHYLAATQLVGVRSFEEMMLPTPRMWLSPGEASVLYGPLAALPWWVGIYLPGQPLGFGLLTSVLTIVGLALGRRQRWLLVLGFAALILVTLSTRVGEDTAWRVVYDWVPGARAIRAVTRVSLVVSIPVSLSVAAAVDRLRAAFAKPGIGPAIAAGLGLFCLAEQAKYQSSFDKEWNRAVVREIASRLDPTACDAFFHTAVGPTYHPSKYSIDAMWAALESGVPTINGYTGFRPPGWYLSTCTVVSPGDDERLRSDLARWVEQNRLDPARVCQVRLRSRVWTAPER